VTYQRIVRQRLDKYPAVHIRNNRTAGLCNSFLGNGSAYAFPHRQRRHTRMDRGRVTKKSEEKCEEKNLLY
jgi:hypothetical protein